MKYLSKIQKVSYYYFLLSLCMVQGQGLKYNLFPPTPVLNDIYITDQEESYTLVLEFSGANFDISQMRILHLLALHYYLKM